MVARLGAAVALAAALGAAGAGESRAQSSLGGQRVGTSSGDFLKIGMGAKAVAMGEAYIAIADDPTALYWNPAGIAALDHRAIQFTHTNWLTDVNINYLAAVTPAPRLAGGAIGIQIVGLSTDLEETTEFAPNGTGRSFGYSDFLIGASYARYFTDKFAIGFNLKYFREDVGSEVGGGVVNALLADLGTMYDVGFGGLTFAVAVANFGPELTPSDGYLRYDRSGAITTTQQTEYLGFSPPTAFKIGISSRFRPSESWQGVGALEMNRPGDNAETFRLGGEMLYRERLALRLGYDFNADEMQFSGGGGVRIGGRNENVVVDYAFTDSENFGRIDRFSLGLEF